MGKVVFMDPIEHISGKIAKKFQTIYNHRNASGLNFTSVRGVRTASIKPGELEVRQKFRTIIAAVNTRAQDMSKMAADQAAFERQKAAGGKYTTLRGFLFGKVYENYNDETGAVVWPNSL